MIDTHQEDKSGNRLGERDRRTKKRFRIEQEVRYKMLYGQRIAETGTGKTMNISSSGVWFSTENMLTSGMPVELSMSWPVLLNDSCPMKLMIYGCVVRSNERGAAVAGTIDYSLDVPRSNPAAEADSLWLSSATYSPASNPSSSSRCGNVNNPNSTK